MPDKLLFMDGKWWLDFTKEEANTLLEAASQEGHRTVQAYVMSLVVDPVQREVLLTKDIWNSLLFAEQLMLTRFVENTWVDQWIDYCDIPAAHYDALLSLCRRGLLFVDSPSSFPKEKRAFWLSGWVFDDYLVLHGME